jgi:hypothetical protein
MPYSPQDRQRINLRAKRKLGQAKKTDKQSEDDFMEQCISNMEDQGVDNPEDVCATLWEDQDSSEGD